MKKNLLNTAMVLIVFGVYVVLLPSQISAASLTSVKDIISTSRPSASAPISTTNVGSTDRQATIVDNGSIYIASDAATFQGDIGETQNANVNVASASATGVPSAGKRVIYFTQNIGNTHHIGDAVYVPITATHSITFTTVTAVPASGHVIISFPGTGVNSASPSASTFSFNGMTASNPTDVKFNGVTCSSVAVAAPTIDCTVNASGIGAGTVVTVLIGCTTGTTTCTAFAPRLINPTVSSTQCSGSTCTAGPSLDVWKISIKTQDNNSIDLDLASTKIATIQSVQVQATVEPTLTFSITGLANGVALATQNSNCGASTLSSGIDSTATTVNLGVLSNGVTSYAGQELSVSTNAASGYAITATSSGRLRNPASGFWITDANDTTSAGLTANDTPTPKTITAGTPAFGIHACGIRSSVNTDQWVNNGAAAATGTTVAKFSNPWNTTTGGFYNTIASYTGGAVTGEKTEILYGSTVAGSTPAGIYLTTLTYVATATF